MKKKQEKGSEELIITLGITVLMSTIKNPKKKQDMRNVCLKAFRGLKTAYAGDPDFE